MEPSGEQRLTSRTLRLTLGWGLAGAALGWVLTWATWASLFLPENWQTTVGWYHVGSLAVLHLGRCAPLGY